MTDKNKYLNKDLKSFRSEISLGAIREPRYLLNSFCQN